MTSLRMALSSTASWRAPIYILCIGRGRVPCVRRACAVHTRARAHVACACACACALARVHVCTTCARVHHVCTTCAPRVHAWLQVGVGKHQRLHDGDRVEVFNRDLLRHRTASAPTHPSTWRSASLLAPLRFSLAPALLRPPAQRHHPNSRPGRTYPSLTQNLTVTLTQDLSIPFCFYKHAGEPDDVDP